MIIRLKTIERIGDRMSILSIDHLEKHEKDTLIFPTFNLNVSSGEVVAIHSNMNVRHTLVEMFEGRSTASSGNIVVNGNSYHQRPKRYFRNLGFSSLNEGLYERLRVKDHFLFHKNLYGSSLSIEEMAKTVSLSSRIGVKVGNLTSSEIKRVQFARVLFQNPDLFIFEEPLQNVDLETNRIFINLVQLLSSQGKAVVILTGNIENGLSVTDRVYRLGDTGFREYDVKPSEEGVKEERETD